MPAHLFSTGRRLPAAAATLGFLLAASSSQAQDRYAPANTWGSPEQVYVYGPPRGQERGATGAPIEDLSISRPVRYDDLDLRSSWGAYELRRRIAITSERLCRQLNQFYPTTLYPLQTDSYDCYRRALGDAMYQVDMAIARARSYAD